MMKRILYFFNNSFTRIGLGAALLLGGMIFEKLGVSVVAPVCFALSLLTCGYSVFIDAIRGILRRDLLDEKFLMSIASVGAMIVGEFSEGVAVMLFFLVGETFEQIAVRRSRRSIKALMDFCPDEANLFVDGKEMRVDADEVEVGSEIIIRPGERVPLDSVIVSGEAEVDTSAMTGEAIPVFVKVGDTVESGVVVVGGLLKARTVKTADSSSAQRILELVENASENKSKEESFITKFSHYYTPCVVALAALLAIIPPAFGLAAWDESVYRALIFLVISCPCALVISVPMAFFGGIGGSASRGILFKGGNVFSALKKADTIAFDKTGTLTTGEITVKHSAAFGVSREELYRLAASAEFGSNHPIARCLKKLCSDTVIPDSFEEITGEGTVAHFEGSTVLVGNEALMKRNGINIPGGITASVFVAKNGVMVGYIILSDEIKENAREALEELSRLGLKRRVMLSGDKEENVLEVSEAVGIKEASSKLTPEGKYRKLEQMISESAGGVIYVGDGINDAPSIALADVGIAMGGVGQDSAIEAADIVLMSDDISKIAQAKRIASKTLAIAKENIVFALGVKLLVMALGAFGLANMWLAVFADVGVAVIAILNSVRTLAYSKRSKR